VDGQQPLPYRIREGLLFARSLDLGHRSCAGQKDASNRLRLMIHDLSTRVALRRPAERAQPLQGPVPGRRSSRLSLRLQH
jgi:hypothetical protein